MSQRLPVITAILLLLLSACGKEIQPIRIGTTPWPGYEFLHLAEELGYFEEEGVAVQLVDFLSLADSSRAFERGQVDVWGATLVELVLSHMHSQRHAQAFLVTNESAGGDVVLAREPISTAAELKGRRIGVEPSTVDVVLLHHTLQKTGLDIEQVKLVPMAQTDMLAALENGQVDAVCTYPPNSVHIAHGVAVNKIFDSAQIPNSIIDVLAGDQVVIDKRREELAAITRAFFRAREFARQNPNKALNLLAQWSRITEQDLREVLQGIRLSGLDEQMIYLQTTGNIESALDSTIQALKASSLHAPFSRANTMYTDVVIRQLAPQ